MRSPIDNSNRGSISYRLRDISPFSPTVFSLMAWLSGSALVLINVVTLRRARLILGWVTYNHHRITSHLGQLSLSCFRNPGSTINEHRQYAGVKALESPLSGGR